MKESLFNFLVKNSIYPFWSKKGKVFLRCSKKGFLENEKKDEIIRELNLKTKEDCENLRKSIKKQVSLERDYLPIKNWIKEERPREMLLKYGPEKLPLSKLLAIILRVGKINTSAEELAKKLLNKFSSLRNIDSASISEICSIEGIGLAKAVQIKAALELGKRFYRESAEKKKSIKKPEDVLSYVKEYYGAYLRDANKEFFYVILLDIKNKPIENIEISRGSLNAAIVDPKEIVKEASLKSASNIILVHNHPSGDSTPSEEDIALTNQICEVCEIFEIKILDHIIIGKNEQDYFSFAREGILK
jgi:DNA repair protein RadC